MKVQYQIRAFEQVFESYDGQQPLHRFLPGYFRLHKQMGSSDRRWASRYMYSYFRLGQALKSLPPLERLAIADFLCNDNLSLISSYLFPELAELSYFLLAEKIQWVQSKYKDFEMKDIFHFDISLSNGIDKTTYGQSFFIQPYLFIRVNSTKIDLVKNQLISKDIIYQELNGNCFALPNGTKLEQVLDDISWYQVQDYSSQQTGNFYKPQPHDYWWDCCAASGGKSLLLHSIEPQTKLLVSDIRETSLGNLEERFRSAGIKQYQKKVLDLLQNNEQILHHYKFDGILLDAPCSGSGTWGRTPEMLHYFDTSKLEKYVYLQKTIASNVVKYLKANKPLIYMTCSVFKQENEDVVAYLLENFPLKLEEMQLIEGYTRRADSLFVARLIKNDEA